MTYKPMESHSVSMLKLVGKIPASTILSTVLTVTVGAGSMPA